MMTIREGDRRLRLDRPPLALVTWSSAEETAPRPPRRRRRVDWYGMGVLLLMLSVALTTAACLLWAMP